MKAMKHQQVGLSDDTFLTTVNAPAVSGVVPAPYELL